MKKTNLKKQAWVFQYLSKKGKDLNTLEKAIMRMTKAETVEKFRELDWGLTIGHTKIELVSIILDELQDLGYQYEEVKETKKAKKAHVINEQDAKEGLEIIKVMESIEDNEQLLKALGFEVGMDANAWWEEPSIKVAEARALYGIDIMVGVRFDELFFLANKLNRAAKIA